MLIFGFEYYYRRKPILGITNFLLMYKHSKNVYFVVLLLLLEERKRMQMNIPLLIRVSLSMNRNYEVFHHVNVNII